MIPKSVVCDITGVEHLVVTSEQNVSDLIAWSKSLVSEMNSGKIVCISIDCEGWNLGAIPNSLGLVQLAQCYDDHIFEKDVETPISLNLKPGFMVKYPTSQEVTDALSSVLSHDNVRMITFDFTSDFCAMMEAGIKLNTQNAFDTHTFGCKGSYFPNRSLKEVCEAGDLCTEYEKCINAIEKKKTISFSKLVFDFRNEEHPFDCMLDKEFWDYSSHDIALTALAGISCVTKYGVENVFEYSKNKSSELLECQEKNGVLAPSIRKNVSFILKYVDMMSKTTGPKFAFNNYSRSYAIVNAWDVIDPETKKSLKHDKDYFIESMKNAEKYILENPAKIENFLHPKKKSPFAWPT